MVESNVKMASSKYLTPNEIDGVTQVRTRFADILPNDLDTDLYLARWWRYYGGKMTEIEKHFSTYLGNRKAGNFDRKNFIENAFDDQINKIKFPIYSTISKLDDAIDPNTNHVVFIERPTARPKVLSKCARCYDYMFGTFGYCEYIQQLILRQEKSSRRPSSSVILFDTQEFNILDYVNIFSTHFKGMLLRSKIWQECFPEMISHVIVLNPPHLMSIVWRIVKMMIHEHNRIKITFASSYRELFDHLGPSVIPACYGGNLKDLSGFGDPFTCCRPENHLTDKDAYEPGIIFKEAQLDNIPDAKFVVIKPHHSFAAEYCVNKSGGKLVWQFWANGEVEFGVTRMNVTTGAPRLVWPRLSITAKKVPEERIFECEQAGIYKLEFGNNDRLFNLKIEYTISLIE